MRILSLIVAASLAAGSALAAPEVALPSLRPSMADLAKVAAAAPATAGCPLALSAVRGKLYADGVGQIVTYDDPPVTAHAAWLARSVLVAPTGCGGRYLLSLSFVRDAQAARCAPGKTGTNGDVSVSFHRIREGVETVLGAPNGAWAGLNAGVRTAGASSIVAVLNAGDLITTWSTAAANRPRCMMDITFTAATLN